MITFNKLFVVALLLGVIFVQTFTPATSSYLFWANVLDCNNTTYLRGCRHEIGHKMDDNLNQPSQSYEFSVAVNSYLLKEYRYGHPSDLAIYIHDYPAIYKEYYPTQKAMRRELYAAIYAHVNGDISLIPRGIRRFYSKDPLYESLYSCLAQPGQFNICGMDSFSYIAG